MLSQRLKALRAEKKISQKELAAKLYVSAQAISKWERDEATPNPDAVRKIANILGVTTDYLLGADTLDALEKKEPATVSGDGQAEKLAQALTSIGIDVDSLSDADISRIARLAKAALEE